MIFSPSPTGATPPRRRIGAHHAWVRPVGTGALLLTLLSTAEGATLSSESSAALTYDYNSNPLLVTSDARSAQAVALLADLPLTYTRDSQSLDLEPRFRYAQTRGVAQLLTDYVYLDADWHLSSERNSLTASIGWHRDSTIYNTYETAAIQGRTLPRVEEVASLAWQRTLSERSHLQFTGSWDQVAYSAASDFKLDDYSYVQGSIQYLRALSERWNWTASTGVGRYEQGGAGTSHENLFVQSSLTWLLSERWTTTAQLGYTWLHSSAQAFICCQIVSTASALSVAFIPVEQKSSGGTVNYALTAERQNERVNWSLSASSSVLSGGLGAPLIEESVSIGASLPWTERLRVGTTLHGSRLSQALASNPQVSHGMYYDFGLNADWQWTEHWTVGAQGTYHLQRALAQAPESSNWGVSFTLTRAFGRMQL